MIALALVTGQASRTHLINATRAVVTTRRLLANPFGVAVFPGGAPTRLRLATAWQAERGGYSGSLSWNHL